MSCRGSRGKTPAAAALESDPDQSLVGYEKEGGGRENERGERREERERKKRGRELIWCQHLSALWPQVLPCSSERENAPRNSGCAQINMSHSRPIIYVGQL